MRSTFKVLFYVKKGSEKPNGNLPLMCRITVDGEIKQFSCKMDVPPRLWDVKNSRFPRFFQSVYLFLPEEKVVPLSETFCSSQWNFLFHRVKIFVSPSGTFFSG
mgnify:CR=1 FL=1